MKKKDGSFVMLFKDDSRQEIFLVYRSDWPLWNLIGGGIEPGETPKTAVIRENVEETGLKIKVDRYLGVYEYHHPKTHTFVNYSHLFEGRYISGVFKAEFSGCKGQWFSINKLPVDITNTTKMRVIDAINFSGKEFHKTLSIPQLKDNLHLFIRHPIAIAKYFSRR